MDMQTLGASVSREEVHSRSDPGGASVVVRTVGELRSPSIDDDAKSYVHSRQKRALDIMIAIVVLLMSAPVLFLLAILVKLTSDGPVIFKQKRNGIGGCFNIYKFRTMYLEQPVGDDDFVRQASRGDARVTPVGYWLRRLSLDELPQIFNVLQGRMSIVGPRPHALSHDVYYARHVQNYMLRYNCKPGITGLAQVSGARGETQTHNDMAKRVAFDLAYIERASFAMDIRLLFKTVHKLADNRNVY